MTKKATINQKPDIPGYQEYRATTPTMLNNEQLDLLDVIYYISPAKSSTFFKN